ncbi:MAG: cytochrome B [Anaerolineae bacterium CG_4_9_14_3_um_filter_57_17]|nr:hypothetical protein [bacterium]NCT21037.1 hypothetical protein [bacterium]OIO83322.1 MAG: hypothetical protein AUK01_12840 [Anaerolineae bacterium CG2_30_57_67]PJB67859.1 MAG: cytochrome B [Anaerolineae bacterium CG_4_9_14_3_um_filter_57_17]
MSKTSSTFERFPLIRRIEHVLMLTSFSTLGLTGLPQKYPDSGISQAIVNLLGNVDNLRQVHHVAATFLMLGTIYHLMMFGYKFYVERARLTMLPSLQDAKDALQAFLYNLGFAKARPQMGRYGFEEKAEYWAFVWGTVVMAITGYMMWNPIATTMYLPGEFIPAAKAAHGAEAVLAVLAILLWHFYGVHLKTLNKAMWTGHLTEEEMLHEHPLELADIKAGIDKPVINAVTLAKRQRIYWPIAIVISAAMLYGVYNFVTSENTAITTVPIQDVGGPIYSPQTPTPQP